MKQLILVAMFVAGCGGTDVTHPHESMLGTWTGQAILAGGDVLPAHVTVSRVPLDPGQPSDAVLLHGFCPDGNGAAFMSGQDTSTLSDAAIECPRTTVGTCVETYVLYSIVTANLSADNELQIEALGFANGCDVTSAFRLDITAQRGK